MLGGPKLASDFRLESDISTLALDVCKAHLSGICRALRIPTIEELIPAIKKVAYTIDVLPEVHAFVRAVSAAVDATPNVGKESVFEQVYLERVVRRVTEMRMVFDTQKEQVRAFETMSETLRDILPLKHKEAIGLNELPQYVKAVVERCNVLELRCDLWTKAEEQMCGSDGKQPTQSPARRVLEYIQELFSISSLPGIAPKISEVYRTSHCYG